jgi:hypothetical protein
MQRAVVWRLCPIRWLTEGRSSPQRARLRSENRKHMQAIIYCTSLVTYSKFFTSCSVRIIVRGLLGNITLRRSSKSNLVFLRPRFFLNLSVEGLQKDLLRQTPLVKLRNLVQVQVNQTPLRWMLQMEMDLMTEIMYQSLRRQMQLLHLQQHQKYVRCFPLTLLRHLTTMVVQNHRSGQTDLHRHPELIAGRRMWGQALPAENQTHQREQLVDRKPKDPIGTFSQDYGTFAPRCLDIFVRIYQPRQLCSDSFVGKMTPAFHVDCDLGMLVV